MSASWSSEGSRAERPRILCVDDEPHILDSLTDTLHRRFDVRTATSGADGLAQLSAEPDGFAVVMSDMRMPAMSGAVFLREARHVAPDATRILLTGYADLDAAISAVNDGQLFRFLTKPCPADVLLATCDAALEQHRLRTAEKVLLEQTLKGSVGALSDVLALANPAAFGRSASVRKYAQRLASALEVEDMWEVEVAAMLAQLGAVTLPPETAEKVYSGAKLTTREQRNGGADPGGDARDPRANTAARGRARDPRRLPESYGASGCRTLTADRRADRADRDRLRRARGARIDAERRARARCGLASSSMTRTCCPRSRTSSEGEPRSACSRSRCSACVPG